MQKLCKVDYVQNLRKNNEEWGCRNLVNRTSFCSNNRINIYLDKQPYIRFVNNYVSKQKKIRIMISMQETFQFLTFWMYTTIIWNNLLKTYKHGYHKQRKFIDKSSLGKV